MAKPSKLGANPFDYITDDARRLAEAPKEPEEAAEGSPMVVKSYWLPIDLVTKIADVAYAERCAISEVVAHGVRELVERLEKQRGTPYPAKPKGRPRLQSTG